MRRTDPDEYDDAFQDGVFGLLRAVQGFDPDRGFRLSSYAIPWIRKAITDGHERAMGLGYRQALADGVEWEPPLSVDVTGASRRLDAIRSGDAPEVDAITRVRALAAGRALLDVSRDDLDRQLVARFLGAEVPVAELARAHGVTPQAVYVREKTLRARAAEVLADDVPRCLGGSERVA